MEIFLDMDGVLTNLVGGALAHHRIPVSAGDWLDRWPGVYEFDPIIKDYGITRDAFWAPLGREFWAGLDQTADGRGIVVLALWSAPHWHQIHVLSSPCHTPGCRDGKHDWLLRHFPALAPNLMLVPSDMKCRFAGPGKVLVDDSDQNCDQWSANGGRAILVPRPWNRRHADSANALAVVEEEFGKLSGANHAAE